MITLKAIDSADVQQVVRAHEKILPRGGGSKSALSTATDATVCLDLSGLSGIIEYQPSEYTFTAYAGTPVQTVKDELAKHTQYMPFDPILMQQGATLGGTVAANTSGSGRYRYGGVRDFILGIQFVDGQGQLVRSGGKVVKNSAGFDLSKFMVGSLGRYGILVELSFKVFPEPQRYVTLIATFKEINAALQAVLKLASSPLEMDALDIELTGDNRYACLIRLGGLANALPGRLTRLQEFLKRHSSVIEMHVIEDISEQDAPEEARWQALNRFAWADSASSLVKVPLAPKRIPLLDAQLGTTPRRYSAGANVAWITPSNSAELASTLRQLGLIGLQIVGHPDTPYLGQAKGVGLAKRVKQALDPDGKFLPLPNGTG